MPNSSIHWYGMSDGALLAIIGDFIKQNRLQKNKSQQQVALAAGIARSTLTQLENGRGGTLLSLIEVMRVLEQLHLFTYFQVRTQASPLELAKLEQAKRKRARTRKKDGDQKNESSW